MNNHFRNFALWVVIALLLIALFQLFQNPGQQANTSEISYSQFLSEVRSGNVRSVSIQERNITGQYSTGGRFQTYAPEGANYISSLENQGVTIRAEPPNDGISLWGVLATWFPMLLILGIWLFLMRQMQGGGAGKAMGFGKSKAKMLTEQHGRVLFEDVAGVDEAKEDLQEIVDFLKDPSRFQKLGGKIPRGVLLVGPPGTGKTLLARAIAGEANVPFFTISGSDFVEMFVGVGASRVRDMFEQAKKNAPCIIFIDEIDAVGRHRGAGLGAANDEREQNANQLLVEMDGFRGQRVASSSSPPHLTGRHVSQPPALLRPGRFRPGRSWCRNPRTLDSREKILKVHRCARLPLPPDVDLKTLCPRATRASLARTLRTSVERGMQLPRRSAVTKRLVTHQEFRGRERNKVMMGPSAARLRHDRRMKKKTHRLREHRGRATALVGSPLCQASDPIHKAKPSSPHRAARSHGDAPAGAGTRFSLTPRQVQGGTLAAPWAAASPEELIFRPREGDVRRLGGHLNDGDQALPGHGRTQFRHVRNELGPLL